MFPFCRFQCVQMPNQVLESISIIDTPGILTAAKRKLSRGEMLTSNSLLMFLHIFEILESEAQQMKLIRQRVGRIREQHKLCFGLWTR